MSDDRDRRHSLILLVRPAIMDQFHRAISLLEEGRPLAPTTVHEVRRSVKRIRALLQLVRSDLKEQFSNCNQQLRNVNRCLSAVRDVDVCREAVQERLPDAAPPQRLVLEHLDAELSRQKSASVAANSDDVRLRLASRLKDLHAALSQWRPDSSGFGLIKPSLRRLSKRARRLIDRMNETVTSDDLHTLRKLVKRRAYWLEALEPVWPRGLRAEKKLVASLADRLGQHHDLEVLIDQLRRLEISPTAESTKAAKELVRTLRHQQRQAEHQALKQARYLFAERPGAFVRRWESLIAVWERSAPRTPPQESNAARGDAHVRPRPR